MDQAKVPRERALRVVIAEDDHLLRAGLTALLQADGLEILAAVSDAATLLDIVDQDRPDVVVTDIRMPPGFATEGLDAAVTIRHRHPDVAVLVLSQHVVSRQALELMGKGARSCGYLLKSRIADTKELLDAIRRVAAGDLVVDPDLVQRLIEHRRRRLGLDDLTDREREILGLMAQGHHNGGISARLHISPKTLERHVASIFAKLDLPPSADGHRRVLAVLAHLGA